MCEKPVSSGSTHLGHVFPVFLCEFMFVTRSLIMFYNVCLHMKMCIASSLNIRSEESEQILVAVTKYEQFR